MAYCEMKNASYEKFTDMDNLIKYIMNKADYVGGIGVILLSPEAVLNQMLIIKEIHHKNTGRQMRHFWVSFSRKEDISIEDALHLGYMIAEHYKGEYQIVFGVHDDSKNVHIHFAMNTVSFKTGLKYAEGFNDYEDLKRHVKNVVNLYKGTC